MKTILSDVLYSNNVFIRNRYRDEFFKKFHPNLYYVINDKISNKYSFKEKLYIVYYNIEEPVCKICNSEVHLISFNKGFRTYCCKRCMESDIDIKNKTKETNIRKFGYDNPNKNSVFREKTKKTIIKKYGVESVLSSELVKNKIKKTNLSKYGYENPFQSEEIKKKIIETNLNKFGVEHNSLTKNVIEKRKVTFVKKYGCDNPSKNRNIIDKRNETINLKYIKKYAKLLNITENNITSKSNGDVTINNFCKKHISFNIGKQNLFNRIRYGVENICTKCNPISEIQSIKENEIYDFIKLTNTIIIRKDRKILNGLELDIYLPDYKLGIEFNGLYWHSNKYKYKNYHLNKTELCEKQNIQLLHIFEDEWIDKKEIVKSIIKSKLNIFENKIFTTNCDIKEVDNKSSEEFLVNNHIQGNINSEIQIGLFSNNELVSLMTFNLKYHNSEIIQFSNILNTEVVDSASKLLNYFIETYKPKNIITYVDRRYSQGNLYKRLGFDFIENTKPNYWYLKKSQIIRFHRFNLEKNKLLKDDFDSNKTEFEIMNGHKHRYIHDCGNSKFLKTI